MTHPKFSAVLCTSLAVVLAASSAEAANARPTGSSNPSREPFSIRFPGFLPVDYLKFAPKQEDEPEIRLCHAAPASTPIDEKSERADFSYQVAQIGGGHGSHSAGGGSSSGGGGKSAPGKSAGVHSGSQSGQGSGKSAGDFDRPDAVADHPAKNDDKPMANAGGGGNPVPNGKAPAQPGGGGGPLAFAPQPKAATLLTPVPEPGTVLFGVALLGACAFTRRRSRQTPVA